jgi:UDP-2-acetamido-3-amino-2,3-dideoxy-glucuronate N-acetyltransferase
VPDWQIHSSALCESDQVGAGSSIQAFAHIGVGVRVGRDCSIGGHAQVGPRAILGDRVTLGGGVRIADGVRLDDDVFVGPNATIGHDPSGPGRMGQAVTVVHEGASIGANVTILAGLTIGARARLAPGSAVVRSVPANAMVAGNPAQIIGYASDSDVRRTLAGAADSATRATSVRGVTLHHMREVEDMRGNLSVAELGREVPFEVKRYFLVYGVPNMEVRGEHAHLKCHQFLIAVKGSLHVVADDGRQREEFVLDRPSLGLHLPPMTWGTQYRYSADAVLLVLASHHYDSADYVRDHDRFLALVAAGQPGR